MLEENRDYAEPVDQTAEWENPFVPAPLGDTVVMEIYVPRLLRGEEAAVKLIA